MVEGYWEERREREQKEREEEECSSDKRGDE